MRLLCFLIAALSAAAATPSEPSRSEILARRQKQSPDLYSLVEMVQAVQPEFAAHCVTAAADRAVADGAVALAWTAIDMARDRELSARLRAR